MEGWEKQFSPHLQIFSERHELTPHAAYCARTATMETTNDIDAESADVEMTTLEHSPSVVPSSFTDGACFTLNANALKSLDITSSTDKGSLFKLLNRCTTAQGSRLLLAFLQNPLIDVQEINNRLDIVEYFVNKSSVRTSLTDIHLKKFPDFIPLVRKLEKKKVALLDLYKIYVAVLKIPDLISVLEADLDDDVSAGTKQLIRSRFIAPFEESVVNFANYKDLVQESIDIPHLLRTNDCRVKPNVAPELNKINAKMEKLLEKMENDWDTLADKVGMEKEKTLKFERDSRLGYLYRVTQKEEKNLRQFPELITVDTKTAGYRFRTSKLSQLNAEYLELSAEYSGLQELVVAQLMETAGTFVEPLKDFDQVLAPLDVFIALAKASVDANIPYVRPNILPKESGLVELIASRHPCMENFMSGTFIPNSVRLQHGKSTFHILTGPNMGGKSTYIRQVALTVIMAQIGCFVPCESATVSVIDGVYTRIGASDSFARGVSTFMVEMLETQDILAKATKYSLIVIDELGRGTSTYDGYGLAYAISEHIALKLGSYCLFTTHFTELAELADEVPAVVLSHVSALTDNAKELVFTYNVEPGVCKDSFGINCADIAGLPAHVIESAQTILRDLEQTHSLAKGITPSS